LIAVVAVIGFASVASAADLPTKAPVYTAPVAAPDISWTGFYIGGNVGGHWSNVDLSTATDRG
jgi:opacity protein-like surface antigen